MSAQENARDLLALVDRLDSLEMEVQHLQNMVNDLAGRLFRERD